MRLLTLQLEQMLEYWVTRRSIRGSIRSQNILALATSSESRDFRLGEYASLNIANGEGPTLRQCFMTRQRSLVVQAHAYSISAQRKSSDFISGDGRYRQGL